MKNRSKRLKAAVFQGHTVDLYRCSSMFVCINLGVGKSEVAVSARAPARSTFAAGRLAGSGLRDAGSEGVEGGAGMPDRERYI